jgi:hypothetical protein
MTPCDISLQSSTTYAQCTEKQFSMLSVKNYEHTTALCERLVSNCKFQNAAILYNSCGRLNYTTGLGVIHEERTHGGGGVKTGHFWMSFMNSPADVIHEHIFV